MHARHVFVVASQMGVFPEHSELLVQATHVPVVVLHTGVGATHAVALVAEHWPHAPEGWHAPPAELPVQSVSVAQPVQALFLHTGCSGLVQLALLVQPAVVPPPCHSQSGTPFGPALL